MGRFVLRLSDDSLKPLWLTQNVGSNASAAGRTAERGAIVLFKCRFCQDPVLIKLWGRRRSL